MTFSISIIFFVYRKFTEIKNCNSDVDVESGDDCDIVEMIIQAPKEKWDCESILSRF